MRAHTCTHICTHADTYVPRHTLRHAAHTRTYTGTHTGSSENPARGFLMTTSTAVKIESNFLLELSFNTGVTDAVGFGNQKPRLAPEADLVC